MPEAVPVIFAGYLELEGNFTLTGLRVMTERDRATVFALMRESDVPKHLYPTDGGEEGFIGDFGKFVVVVWTSCLRRILRICRLEKKKAQGDALPFCLGEVVSRPTSTDAAHVLILQRKENGLQKAAYFARDVRRTKGFVKKLSRRAWVTVWKARHPPECEKCGGTMEIHRKKDGGNCWACFSVVHELYKCKEERGPFFRRWHYGLPPKALKIAEGWDLDFEKQLDKYRKKRRDEGKPPPERASRIHARALAKRRAKA